MNDKMVSILKFVAFIFCLFLVVFGQATVGKVYLLIQLIGLAGILVLLWDYNRKYV